MSAIWHINYYDIFLNFKFMITATTPRGKWVKTFVSKMKISQHASIATTHQCTSLAETVYNTTTHQSTSLAETVYNTTTHQSTSLAETVYNTTTHQSTSLAETVYNTTTHQCTSLAETVYNTTNLEQQHGITNSWSDSIDSLAPGKFWTKF